MRHANLPLPVLAPSVAFAPQSSTARFLWRGISAAATAGVAPSCTVLALAVRLLHGISSATAACSALLCAALLFFGPSIRSRCGGWWASLAAAAPVVTPPTRGEMGLYCNGNSPMRCLRHRRIKSYCDRDGSRAPHRRITGGLHPRSSVILRLATTGHAARVPPECLQNAPAPPAQRRCFSRAPQHTAEPDESARRSHRTLGSNIAATGRYLVCAPRANASASRRYRISPCAAVLGPNRTRHDQD